MNVFGKITLLARPARIRLVITCAEIDRNVSIVKAFEPIAKEAEIGIGGVRGIERIACNDQEINLLTDRFIDELTIRIGNGFDQTISPHWRDCTQPPERGSEMKVCCVYEGY